MNSIMNCAASIRRLTLLLLMFAFTALLLFQASSAEAQQANRAPTFDAGASITLYYWADDATEFARDINFNAIAITATDPDGDDVFFTSDADVSKIGLFRPQSQPNGAYIRVEDRTPASYAFNIKVIDSHGVEATIAVDLQNNTPAQQANQPPTFADGSSITLYYWTDQEDHFARDANRNVFGLTASDPNSDLLLFSISAWGVGESQVSVYQSRNNPNTPYIRVIDKTQSAYTVYLQADDRRGGTATITVNLQQQSPPARQAPVFVDDDGTLNDNRITICVMETTRTGWRPTTRNNVQVFISVTDQSRYVEFSAPSGPDKDSVQVTTTRGLARASIAVKGPIDFETKPSYDFTLQATDIHGLTATVPIHIMVLDMVQNTEDMMANSPPGFDEYETLWRARRAALDKEISDGRIFAAAQVVEYLGTPEIKMTRSVTAGAAVGTNVGLPVTASDPDGDQVSYGIVADKNNQDQDEFHGDFAIDSTGQITVTGQLNRAVGQTYKLWLVITDAPSAGDHASRWTYRPVYITVEAASASAQGQQGVMEAPPAADDGSGATTRSARSASSTATQSAAALPGKPDAPSGSNIGETQFRITWTAPTEGSSPISLYDIEYKLSSDADSAYAAVIPAPSGAGTGYNLIDKAGQTIAAGTSYDVRVRARNAEGWGPWSDASAIVTASPPQAASAAPPSASAAPPAATPTPAPRSPRSARSADAAAEEEAVEDAPADDASDGADAVEEAAAEDAPADDASDGADAVEDAPADDTADSAAATETAPALPKRLDTPGNVSVAAQGDGSILVSWDASANAAADYYRIRRSADDGKYTTIAREIADGGALDADSAKGRIAYLDDGSALKAGKTYSYKVRAFHSSVKESKWTSAISDDAAEEEAVEDAPADDASDGADAVEEEAAEDAPAADSAAATETARALPKQLDTPGNVSVAAQGDGSILVSWDASANAAPDYYRIRRSADDGKYTTIAREIADGGALDADSAKGRIAYLDDGSALKADETYSYKVRAFHSSVKESKWTSAIAAVESSG